MERKDYLMRYIEQLGKVLANLLGFREKGDSKGGLEAIDVALREMVDLDSAGINAIREVRLVDELTSIRGLQPEQVGVVAELLFREAEFMEMEGHREDALARFRKSRLLLLHLDRTEGVYSMDRMERIQEIEQRLENR